MDSCRQGMVAELAGNCFGPLSRTDILPANMEIQPSRHRLGSNRHQECGLIEVEQSMLTTWLQQLAATN